VAIRCPGLLAEGDRGDEVRAFLLVLRAAEQLCPWVTPARLGVCTLPARGPSRLLGGEPAVVDALAAEIASACPEVEVQIGVAPGLFGAQLAARVAAVVGDAELADFLAPWSIAVLGRAELATTLPRLGVRTLGELAALPARQVYERFGADALSCHRAASGQVGELPGLRDLAISARLATVAGVSRPSVLQPDFYGGADAAGERAAAAVTRLQGRFGPEAVAIARHRGARDPAARGRLVPFGSEEPLGEPGSGPWPGRLPAPSPTSVLERPRPAAVADVVGRPLAVGAEGLLDGVPDRCAVDGGPWRSVEEWGGPWPVLEHFWSTPRRRARLQLVLEGGVAILVCFEQGNWVLEAVYD